MKYKWLLFDFDNTLIDFNNASILAFQQTLMAFNIPSQPHFYSLYKKINYKVWNDYENKKISSTELRSKRFELFLKEIEHDDIPEKLSTSYLSLLVQHSNLLEGVKALLEDLSVNYKMAIITNGLKEVQRPRLALTQIDHYFEAIVVSDEIGVAKPQIAYFDYVFREIRNPSKSNVLVIGDSLHSDIKGGNNYGLDTCWYNPKGDNKSSDIKPTYEINTLVQLKTLLK